MPEHDTRVYVLGLRAAARRFKQFVENRVAAEMSAKEILRQMDKLAKDCKSLQVLSGQAGRKAQVRARNARRRKPRG